MTVAEGSHVKLGASQPPRDDQETHERLHHDGGKMQGAHQGWGLREDQLETRRQKIARRSEEV